jgi:hypothetical protein
LLRADVLAIGYPLYAAVFLATIWAGGAAVSALLSRGPASEKALGAFAARRLRLGAIAWGCALVLGATPMIRFAIVANGASLFR